MAETSDYDPGAWRGHDFKTAYTAYDATAGRAYTDAVAADAVKPTDLVPEKIDTDSESPVVILLDGTGSMSTWPATIFSKLPYLDIEGKEYMGPTMAISFSVFSDAYGGAGKGALQVKPFVKGTELKDTLAKMFIPGGGGGGLEETSELGMLYYARNANMPNATKPLFILITDEKCYDWVETAAAKTWARVDTIEEKRLSAHKIIGELKRKFNVYGVIKPYSGGSTDSDPTTKAVYEHWIKLLGDDHVVSLPDPNRVVDVIFGIMARETGRVDYFVDELKDRQLKDAGGDKKVDIVLRSLNTIHKSVKALPGPDADASAKKGASVTIGRGKGASKKSISLLD